MTDAPWIRREQTGGPARFALLNPAIHLVCSAFVVTGQQRQRTCPVATPGETTVFAKVSRVATDARIPIDSVGLAYPSLALRDGPAIARQMQSLSAVWQTSAGTILGQGLGHG